MEQADDEPRLLPFLAKLPVETLQAVCLHLSTGELWRLLRGLELARARYERAGLGVPADADATSAALLLRLGPGFAAVYARHHWPPQNTPAASTTEDALMCAIEAGNITMVKLLLSVGWSLDCDRLPRATERLEIECCSVFHFDAISTLLFCAAEERRAVANSIVDDLVIKCGAKATEATLHCAVHYGGRLAASINTNRIYAMLLRSMTANGAHYLITGSTTGCMALRRAVGSFRGNQFTALLPDDGGANGGGGVENE